MDQCPVLTENNVALLSIHAFSSYYDPTTASVGDPTESDVSVRRPLKSDYDDEPAVRHQGLRRQNVFLNLRQQCQPPQDSIDVAIKTVFQPFDKRGDESDYLTLAFGSEHSRHLYRGGKVPA